MKFRTEIQPQPHRAHIGHDERIVMLGSCFTDNIGEKLEQRGFQVCHNPMGPLYNPASIFNIVTWALQNKTYTEDDLVSDAEGCFHCLDFPLRYSSPSSRDLLETVNRDFSHLASQLQDATVVIITLGTSRIFTHNTLQSVVGNCHKLPTGDFTESRLDTADAELLLSDLVSALAPRRVIFTVSPIRHGGTLHLNQLSKATLLLAVDKVCSQQMAEYFPAYEIMLDDLRDYRFYAEDMRHPSPVAVDYIFDIFSKTYFSPQTALRADECYKHHLRQAHRSLLSS